MMIQDGSRRRLLELVGAGLATGLAGCTGNRPTSNNEPVTRFQDSAKTDDPDVPPITFDVPSGVFTLWDRPEFKGTWESLTDSSIEHLDRYDISQSLDEETAEFIFFARIRRAVNFTLYIRNADGDIESLTKLLEVDDSRYFVEYVLTFDLSDIDLPTDAGSFFELTATDTHEENDSEHLIKRHQFVGVEHANGIRWFDDHVFNLQSEYRSEGLVNDTPTLKDGLAVVEDNGDERTVFLVSRIQSHGEVFGVSTTVDKNFVKTYREATISWRKDHSLSWECHFATQVSHLRELAQKTHKAITDLGITNKLDQLNAVADLIQNALSYGTPIQDECPPIIVLHYLHGDCSEKSALLAGILANDPWNVRTGYVDCWIGGEYHWTLGIDQRDLPVDTESIYWVPAKNAGALVADLPDTKYAFLEMTMDSSIGELRPGITQINGIYDTGTFEYQVRGLPDPPNY